MANQIPGKKEVEGQLAEKLGAELELFAFGYLLKKSYIQGVPKKQLLTKILAKIWSCGAKLSNEHHYVGLDLADFPAVFF